MSCLDRMILKLTNMPTVYRQIKEKLCDELLESKNAGPDFHKTVKEFLDMYLEPNHY